MYFFAHESNAAPSRFLLCAQHGCRQGMGLRLGSKAAGAAQEGHISVGGSQLYYREIRQGAPIIVLHGGPDFDQSYLLLEMDRLADKFRLIYYDRRAAQPKV